MLRRLREQLEQDETLRAIGPIPAAFEVWLCPEVKHRIEDRVSHSSRWFRLVCAFFAEEMKKKHSPAREILEASIAANTQRQMVQLADDFETIAAPLQDLRALIAPDGHLQRALVEMSSTCERFARVSLLLDSGAIQPVRDAADRVATQLTGGFHGRTEELAALDAFAEQTERRVLLVRGPAHVGKSSLLAEWTRRQASRTDRWVVFHPIRREDTILSLTAEVYLLLAVEVMAFLGEAEPGLSAALNQLDSTARYKQLESALSRLGRSDDRRRERLVLVLDGLEEADERVAADWLQVLPSGVQVIASLRAGADEHIWDWMQWEEAGKPTLELPGIPAGEIADWLRSSDHPTLAAAAERIAPPIASKVGRHSAFLRFVIEGLKELPQEADEKQVLATVEDIPPEFVRYARKEVEGALRGCTAAENRLVALLLCAKGPLTQKDLLDPHLPGEDAPEESSLPRSLRRWITVVEQVEAQTWEFAAPEARAALLRSNLLRNLLPRAERKLLTFCGAWESKASRYALLTYPEHLLDALEANTSGKATDTEEETRDTLYDLIDSSDYAQKCSHLFRLNPSVHLLRRITWLKRALRIYTEEAFPAEWAMTQNNLGAAWWQLPTGDRAENLRQAINCFQNALKILTETAFPHYHQIAEDNRRRCLKELGKASGEPSNEDTPKGA